MAVGDKQRLITEIVGSVLGQKPELDKSFEWFINKHIKEHFGVYYPLIDEIFCSLNGDKEANLNKGKKSLECDAYFGGKSNFIFEFDEVQHFSSARLQTLNLYPKDLKVNFKIDDWKNYCQTNKIIADKYRKAKTTKDFSFVGGRTAQRAYLDCFRDLLPQQHGLNPTLRISEFEVEDLFINNKETCIKIENLIKIKLTFQ